MLGTFRIVVSGMAAITPGTDLAVVVGSTNPVHDKTNCEKQPESDDRTWKQNNLNEALLAFNVWDAIAQSISNHQEKE